MIELNGKYNTAKVFTEVIEQTAISQIIELCNQNFISENKIRIMPDVHAGKGCTIGTTMTLNGKVTPNLVGVDIGCGMYCVKLKEKEIDLVELDNVIRNNIPSGNSVRSKNHKYNNLINLNKLICKDNINVDRAEKSIGTLGGGNHFIELNKDLNGNIYLVIHSGSRYLGKQIAELYQEKAIQYHESKSKIDKKEIIEELKLNGKQEEIEKKLIELKSKYNEVKVSKDLAYLENNEYDEYLHDMTIAQEYAKINRIAIADVIIEKMKLTVEDSFTTIHNYIEKKQDGYILRKGAIRAEKDEIVLIPINMRDGSILAKGKGNPDWNYSAPHGAGRILSRGKAKEEITLEEFKESMKGIYTTSIKESTIDESPMAYKSIDDIIDNVSETIEIIDIIQPIYNYKAN